MKNAAEIILFVQVVLTLLAIAIVVMHFISARRDRDPNEHADHREKSPDERHRIAA